MLTLHTKRHITFEVVEQPTCFLVYAIPVETTGNETVAVGEPRLFKVVQKSEQPEQYEQPEPLLLAASTPTPPEPAPILSPYVEQVFNTETTSLAWYFAGPPTVR